MARISGIDIPRDKRIDVSLRYVYGIGPTLAASICEQARVEGAKKTSELADGEVTRIREVIDRTCTVEGDLRRQVRQNIQRLIEINCYRGVRHRRGLPLHGQRTRTNARSRKGPKRTVAGRRKSVAKK
ncbi:MAG: 30S ribosomal protein S13 [Chloroflexi bacterium]|nr:30S ribosomal protein S13 [Chloroflexota bacterium]MCH8065372.1 30S ribosomal protein S13 [Chloroflexota bacterium]